MSYKSRNTEKDMKDLIKKQSKTWHRPRFFFFFWVEHRPQLFFFYKGIHFPWAFFFVGPGMDSSSLGAFSRLGLGWGMNVYLVGLRQCVVLVSWTLSKVEVTQLKYIWVPKYSGLNYWWARRPRSLAVPWATANRRIWALEQAFVQPVAHLLEFLYTYIHVSKCLRGLHLHLCVVAHLLVII
jgi:hypothetical protein